MIPCESLMRRAYEAINGAYNDDEWCELWESYKNAPWNSVLTRYAIEIHAVTPEIERRAFEKVIELLKASLPPNVPKAVDSYDLGADAARRQLLREILALMPKEPTTGEGDRSMTDPINDEERNARSPLARLGMG